MRLRFGGALTGDNTMSSSTAVEENKRIVSRIPEAVQAGDFDALDEILAEDVVDHLPAPLGEVRGREEAKNVVRQIKAAFPDLSVTVEDMVAEGDTVAVRVRWNATHEGEYLGIEPTGREVEFRILAFLRLEEGRVVERWIQPDQFGTMHQLGVVEPPGA